MELTKEDVARYFPKRRADAHKGDFGKLLLLCGSRGYTGAPYFAAMGFHHSLGNGKADSGSSCFSGA